jgi:hypothetical protein
MPTFWSTLGCVLETIAKCVKKHFPPLAMPLCSDHGICWHENCVKEYKTCGFSDFHNKCEHFEAQCLTEHLVPQHINILEFLLRYVDYLETCEEEKMLEEAVCEFDTLEDPEATEVHSSLTDYSCLG